MLIQNKGSYVVLEYTGVRKIDIPFAFYGLQSINVGYRPDAIATNLEEYTWMEAQRDFTVTGVLSSDSTNVSDSTNAYIYGTVALTDAGAALLKNGYALLVSRQTDLVQNFEYTEVDNFPAKSHENALGRLTIITQELKEELGYTLHVPPGSDAGASVQQIIALHDEVTSAVERVNEVDARLDQMDEKIDDTLVIIDEAATRAEKARDRAEIAADKVGINASLSNLRRTWQPTTAVNSGGTLTLPGSYYPGRDVLLLFFNGVACSPKHSGSSTDYQYEEVGTDIDVLSNSIILHFPAAATDTFDMMVVSSAAGRNMAEIISLKEELEQALITIDDSVSEAFSSATRATEASALAGNSANGAALAASSAELSAETATSSKNSAAGYAANAAASATAAQTIADAITVDLADVEDRLAVVEPKVVNLETKTTGLDTRTSAVEATSTTHTNDITALWTNVNNNAAQILPLQTRISAAEGNINNLTSRVDSIEVVKPIVPTEPNQFVNTARFMWRDYTEKVMGGVGNSVASIVNGNIITEYTIPAALLQNKLIRFMSIVSYNDTSLQRQFGWTFVDAGGASKLLAPSYLSASNIYGGTEALCFCQNNMISNFRANAATPWTWASTIPSDYKESIAGLTDVKFQFRWGGPANSTANLSLLAIEVM